MKTRFMFWCALLLGAVFSLSVNAQEMQKKADAKPTKAAKEKPAKPTTDPDIKKCIEDKFAQAASLKNKPPAVAVSNAVATITGEAKNGGAKGAATRMATSCGAKEVKNEMTMAAGVKKPAEKKM